MDHRRRRLTNVDIVLTIGDPEVRRIAKLLLKRLGFEIRERY